MAEVPAPLRRDVRLLSTLLGDVLVESHGPELLRDVERLRRATIALRREPTAARRATAESIVARFSPGRAAQVAKAFTAYFQLVNLAEEQHRIRVLRERGRDLEDSLAAAITAVREGSDGEDRNTLDDLLGRLELTPVITAHPTEARRRALVETLWRIGDLLAAHEAARGRPDETADLERRLREEITALWRTDPLRRHSPEPLDEVRAAMALFDQTIFRVVPLVYRELDQLLGGDGASEPRVRPYLRWGSWIGGDRDGNPHVTAEVTRTAAAVQSEHVLLGLEATTRRIARAISASEVDTPPSSELLEVLAEGERAFPRAAKELHRKLPDAPHRRALGLAAHRLAATRAGDAGRYPDAETYLHELRTVQRSLADAGAARLAFGELQHLLWQAETFGFHLASLEVRQHAAVHAEALADPDAPAADEVAATIQAIAEIQRRHGVDACRRYVVSFTRSAADVLAVRELATRAGVDPDSFDVVPLFESRADLGRAPAVLDELLDDPGFVKHLDANDRRLEVMLGYSDSAKDVGVLAANLALHRAQAVLAAWARDRGVRLTLFHGRGGALGRGGGPTNRAILGQAAGSVPARFKVTEQGEVAFARYGNARIARRHLEQLTNAVLLASTPQHDERAAEAWRRFGPTAQRMADAAERAWRDLVERPAFASFFLSATPMQEIAALQLGSRPARRTAGASIEELRAIPWVFAWSQSRVNLPGWFGVGTGLEIAEPDELRAMATDWPFFASLLENTELSLAKADLPIAQRYLSLGGDGTIARTIEDEFARTTAAVLAITGKDRPLDGRPVLRRAIDLRNPYVDALSLLQLRFLGELRGSGGTSDAERLVQITVNGVAAGLQNTG